MKLLLILFVFLSVFSMDRRVGGFEECDEVPEEIVEFANSELDKLGEENCELVWCYVQVVAGLIYKLKTKCEDDYRFVVIYRGFDGSLELKKISDKNDGAKKIHRESHKHGLFGKEEGHHFGGKHKDKHLRRETKGPGGWRKVEVSNEVILGAAEFAVKELNAQSNSIYQFVLKSVLEAYKQVVAGTNYKLKLEIDDGSSKHSTFIKDVIVFQSLEDFRNGEFTSVRILH